MRRHAVTLTVFLGLAIADPVSGQSRREREIERAMEQVGRVVEQSITEAMRAVERTFGQYSHDWDARFQQQGSRLRQGAERLDTTVAFSRTGVVDLTNVSGDIVVTGWSQNRARIQATSNGNGVRWRISASRITLETDGWRGRSGSSRFELSVPEGVRVVVRSHSGDLTVRGVRGPVDATTANGDIEVSDAIDRVDLESLSGDIRAARIRGELDATSVNGDVELEDVEGRSVHIESTSGDLTLLDVRSPDIAASTVSGEVEFRGPLARGGQYEFTSHSGGISLTVPAAVSARFSVETFSGELDSDFPVTLQPNRNRAQSRRLEFVLGSGEARVIAETFSGGVDIRRDNRR